MKKWLSAPVLVGFLLLGCQSRTEAPAASSEPAPSAAAQAAQTAPSAAQASECGAHAAQPAGECGAQAAQPAGECGAQAAQPAGECGAQAAKPAGECGAAQAAGCGCGHSGPVQDNTVSTRTDPATGRTLQAVGTKLTGLAGVRVSELVQHPEKYAGKVVHLEGDVAAMCTHRRAWFSVQDAGDRSGAYVRVITAPSFLVPPESVGKKARAEGTVELVDLPGATTRHLASEHGLGGPPSGKAVIIRASGAEFI